MKEILKKFSVFTAVLLAVLALFAFAGCGAYDKDLEPVGELTVEEVKIIRKTYFDDYRDSQKKNGYHIPKSQVVNVKILQHLGTYDSTVVIWLRNRIEGILWSTYVDEIIVDDVSIGKLTGGNFFWAFDKETTTAMPIETAYESGLLTKDDLLSVAELFANLREAT